MDYVTLAGCHKPIFDNFVYHDSNGSAHPFGNAIWQPCSGTFYAPTQATDNSGYTLTAVGGNDDNVATVITSAGVTITAPDVPTLQDGTGSGSLVDPNGNTLRVSVNGSTTTLVDTLGATVLTINGNPPTSNCAHSPVTYTYTAPGQSGQGQPASVIVSYASYTVQTTFAVSGISEFPATNECLVDKITLPDTSYYQFTYEITYGTESNVTGRIVGVTLPTGGTIVYSYDGYFSCHYMCNSMMADGSPAYFYVTLGGGEWWYWRGYQNGSSHPLQTTLDMLDPALNETDLNFSGLYETQRLAYQGNGSAKVLLRETHSCYNGNWTNCPTAVVTAPITYQSFFNDENQRGPFAAYDYFYNPSGLVTEERDHDFTSGNPIIRIINTNYNTTLCSSSYHICGDPASVQVTDGASPPTQKALTNYTYDNKGNATEISQWVTNTSYLNQQYSYNANGTVATAIDPNGTVTDYHSGGYSCNNAFPKSVSVPGYEVILTTQYTYNCTGGVVTSVTDPNSAMTTTNYTDPYFWRPASTTDPLGNTTYYNYYNVKNFSAGSTMGIGQTESGMIWNSGHSTTDTVTTADALGRPFLTQTRQAPGSGNFDTVETDYDTIGNVNQQSRPFSCALGMACLTVVGW